MSKMTIYKLAEELDMTPSMVSRALSPNGRVREDKRKIVLEAAKKYNFIPNTFASRLSMDTIRIGVLIVSRFDINTQKMLDGIRQAYDSLKNYKIEYDVTVINAHDQKDYDCVQALAKYADYNGVIVTGMSSEKYTAAINDFEKINPRIVLAQAVNEQASCLFASKHDEKTASNIAAEFLYNCLRRCSRKNVLLFTGDIESVLHKKAGDAFTAACKENGLTLLEAVDMKDDAAYLEKILPGIFEKYNSLIDGIYITSGLSIPPL